MKTNAFEHKRVRIQEGVFRNFTGVVENVNLEGHMLTVSVTMFGQEILIELPFRQVQGIE